MIRLKITMSNDAYVTRDFDNQEEADEYLAYISSNGNWGKGAYIENVPEKTIFTPAVLDGDGNIVTPESTQIVAATTINHQAEYTVIQTDVTSELADIQRKSDLKAAGAAARIACQNALDLISGHNLDSDLTPEQITYMTQTFAPILQNLSIGRPGAAKILISNVTPDGTIISQQLKDDVLTELADY